MVSFSILNSHRPTSVIWKSGSSYFRNTLTYRSWAIKPISVPKKLLTSGNITASNSPRFLDKINTNNCRATYAELKAKGVAFMSEPKEQLYGIEALFKDNSGNWFSLTERPKGS